MIESRDGKWISSFWTPEEEDAGIVDSLSISGLSDYFRFMQYCLFCDDPTMTPGYPVTH